MIPIIQNPIGNSRTNSKAMLHLVQILHGIIRNIFVKMGKHAVKCILSRSRSTCSYKNFMTPVPCLMMNIAHLCQYKYIGPFITY